MKTLFKNKQKRGFVILIAVLVSSLMISLGAFIANIAVKELQLSSSGRDSQTAFYAADSGLECALYQDLRVQSFQSTSTVPGPASVYCNGQTWTIVSQSSENEGDPDTYRTTTYFDVIFEYDQAPQLSPYARVKVEKSAIGTINDRTTVEARGYNIRDALSPNRVERALQVIY